ncbi:7722_t:CDS:2 [Cetraspora pellucida]|uniref:7722_t:CDS:1 n=1 Tax=Cetraspora pellucida TaxID=1433469 RepID=A0A9N9N5I2_9GLOM|nr:7722_t:CDS:2 [Cetraspora pellucida]
MYIELLQKSNKIYLENSILQKINLETNENIVMDIDNTEIVEEVTKSTGKAAYRSLKDILSYIIPFLIHKRILQLSDPTLYI